MKTNKLFNTVLTKSAAILVAGATIIGSGAASNIYAKDLTTNCYKVYVNGKVVNFNNKLNCPYGNNGSTNSGTTGNNGSTNSGSTNSGTTGNNGSTNSGSTGNNGSTNNGSTGNNGSTNSGSTNNGSTNSGSTTTQSNFATKVLELVNAERAKQGLNALQLDASVSKVAQTKAQDMSSNNYFSHTSPTYGSPFDMLKQFGVSYSSAGENIAQGYTTPEAVVQGWMNSAGHRANILNAKFTHMGIGYSTSGNYWAQMFIGK